MATEYTKTEINDAQAADAAGTIIAIEHLVADWDDDVDGSEAIDVIERLQTILQDRYR